MTCSKKVVRFICVALLGWFMTGAGLAAAQGHADHVPGRLLVKFRSGVTGSKAQGVLSSLGATEQGTIQELGIKIVSLPPGTSETALEKAFRGKAEVEFAEVDRYVPPDGITPNDPLYPSEWQLPRIAAPDAWSTTEGSGGVTIAILDTGVDPTHPDLASKLVPGWNFYDNNSNTSDVYGHGTKVAGTAAAVGNNANGVASVAWGCLIMPIRISALDGYATYSAMASGLTWAADHGARVANLSYMATTSSTVTSAAQYFYKKGGVVTSSAGNYSTFDSSPDNPYILTISATDENDVLYSWSNTGNNIDLAAPGCVYTTTNGGSYGSACGTSFSAPLVAGVAALVISRNFSLTAAQVTGILQQSADDRGPVGWDPTYGWGRVNAANAVAMAGGSSGSPGGADTQPPSVSITAPADGSTVSGTVTVQVSASDNVGVASVSLYADGVQIGTSTSAPYSFLWNSASVGDGAHSLAAKASDASNNSATATITVNVSNGASDTTAPTIVITSPPDGSSVSKPITVTCQASDNVGVVLVELYVDGSLQGSASSAPFAIKWNPKKASNGAHTMQEKAYDAAGNTGTSAPVIVYK